MFLKFNSQETIYECSIIEDSSNMITNINVIGVTDFADILLAISKSTVNVDVYSDEECLNIVSCYKENRVASFNMCIEDGTALIIIKPTDLQKEISDLKTTVSAQTQQIASIESQINPEPIDPSKLSLEEAKAYQLNLVNQECTNTIHAGIDMETSKGIEHFSLTEVDQININVLYAQCLTGVPSVPYHADGAICREFTAEEMIALGKKALEYVIYCTTLCNHIRAWINRAETVEEAISIHFNSQLPDDLLESFNSIISIGINSETNEEVKDEVIEDEIIDETNTDNTEVTEGETSTDGEKIEDETGTNNPENEAGTNGEEIIDEEVIEE